MRVAVTLMMVGALLAACTSDGGSGSAIPSSSGPPASGSVPPSAAQSPKGPEILPILVNSDITQGPNRFLFSLTDRQNRLVAAPDVTVHLRFYDVDTAPDTVLFEADARFLWAIEGEQGLYVASVDFPDDGRWGTLFEATFPGGGVRTVRADYEVTETGRTPPIGARVPSVATPTLADVGGDPARLSSDPDPDLRLYQTSIADAIAAQRPFVVAFATPAFCESRLCGPSLETVKAVAAEYPDITFINVEPYRMRFAEGRLQPELNSQGQLQAAAWTEAWGLPSEPYVFVVDGDGAVAAKFEGVFAADELRAAVDAL